jgi:hypothetical protein
VSAPRPSAAFSTRVGSLAERFRQGERFATQMGRTVVPQTPEAVRAQLEALVGVRTR